MTFTHALSTNNYGPAKFIVATSAANGTHTTLASAMAAASSGDTIFLRDSVTENVTLTPGVNIAGWSAAGVPSSITGTLTMTSAGTCVISGITLITNSAPVLTVSGSANSAVYLINCYGNFTNNTGISLTSSGTGAFISCTGCILDTTTTGIAVYSMTGGNNIRFMACFLPNSGGSTTASNNSTGNALFDNCSTFGVYSSSSTGSLGFFNCNVDTSAINVTPITLNGSGSQIVNNCYVTGGTASAVSAASTSTGLFGSTFNSSNTNAITGSGQINSSGNSYPGTSQINSTLTQTGGTLKGQTVAPPAGFLGEQISASATSVSVSNGTAKTITSISLTAGIWDISAISFTSCTGVATDNQLSISTTNNTISGSVGVQTAQCTPGVATSGQALTLVVPNFRATLTGTTTYYAVVLQNFSTGTCSANARITATRVG